LIPDILLVSSLFREDEGLKSLKFMNPEYDGKIFIDREFYKLEGGTFRVKSPKDVKDEWLRNIRSIGVLFLLPLSDEKVRFIDLIDRELRYFIKRLEEGSLRDLERPLMRAALQIFLYDKLSIDFGEEIQALLEDVLLKDNILSNIQYFHVITEEQTGESTLREIELPNNENYAELLVESLINITLEMLSIFPQSGDPRELAYRFYKIINSIILNQLTIYIKSVYRSKLVSHKVEEPVANTIELIVDELLLPHLDFVQEVMPSHANIKLREVLSSIKEIYERYVEKLTRMNILSKKSLKELMRNKTSERGEINDDFNVKFFTHLVRNSGIAGLMYANNVVIPYLQFTISILHYLVRADTVYFFTNLYNFVNMMDQVNNTMNTLPYFLAIPSDGSIKDDNKKRGELLGFLSKLYEPGRLDNLKGFIKDIKYFDLSIEGNEKHKFYEIKSDDLEYHLKDLRNSFSITHGVLPVIPITVSEEILDEKFIIYLGYFYDKSDKLRYSANKISLILGKYIEDYVQNLESSLALLRGESEESDSLKDLETLMIEAEEIRGYLISLAEDISELHNKIKQIAENKDGFIKKMSRIVKNIYTYIPEFFIINGYKMKTT
jgi:hypothetical protein